MSNVNEATVAFGRILYQLDPNPFHRQSLTFPAGLPGYAQAILEG